MTREELIRAIKAKVIEAGERSAIRLELWEPKRLGCLVGFQIAGDLETPEQFQRELDARMDWEDLLRAEQVSPAEYWEYHAATMQIRFVYERMRVLWGGYPYYDPVALRQVAQLREVVEQQQNQPT